MFVWFHANFIFYESTDPPYLLTNESFFNLSMEKINHILIKPKYLEMLALETQVPHISRGIVLFNLVSADALASIGSRISADAILPLPG